MQGHRGGNLRIIRDDLTLIPYPTLDNLKLSGTQGHLQGKNRLGDGFLATGIALDGDIDTELPQYLVGRLGNKRLLRLDNRSGSSP